MLRLLKNCFTAIWFWPVAIILIILLHPIIFNIATDIEDEDWEND